MPKLVRDGDHRHWLHAKVTCCGRLNGVWVERLLLTPQRFYLLDILPVVQGQEFLSIYQALGRILGELDVILRHDEINNIILITLLRRVNTAFPLPLSYPCASDQQHDSIESAVY